MALSGGGSRRCKAYRKSRAKSGDAGVWSLESEFNRDDVYLRERDRNTIGRVKTLIVKIGKSSCAAAHEVAFQAKRAAIELHSRRLRNAAIKAANKAFDRRDAKCWK